MTHYNYIDITEIQTTVFSFTNAEGLSVDDTNLELETDDSVTASSLQQSSIQSYHYYMLYFTFSVHVFVFLFGGFNNA